MPRMRRFSSGTVRSKKSASGSQVATIDEECDLVRDTLANVLRTIGSFALPTKHYDGSTFKATMDRLAREVLLKPGSPDRDNNTDRVHKEIRNTVREQRREESREYSQYKEMTTQLLASLVSELKKAFAQAEVEGQHIVTDLTEIEDLTYREEWETLKAKVPETVSGIKEVIARQREDGRTRIQQLSMQLREMREELQEAKSKMERDSLTGLFNRGAMDRTLKLAVKYAHSSGNDLAVFMLDLDHFKRINDTYGHQAGDEVLRSVATVLIKTFMRKNDFVARYGGEEFLVICKDMEESDAPRIGERARQSIEKLKVVFDDATIPVTASIGYAVLRPGETAEELIERVDRALYQAKAGGRNRVVGAE